MNYLERQTVADWLRELESPKLLALASQLGVENWRTEKRSKLRTILLRQEGILALYKQATK